ncbi:MAG TPA: glycoside hydrolase family 38 C-terminal domain-containing protein [Streptosporangiaceae bacterium]|nr:glycoside hydrolase family 38 C-terminal domain-containing protein [Streptosporangiaceae bacterium]
MRISGVDSTDLFLGSTARPLQVVRVHLQGDGASGDDGPVTVSVHGPSVSTPEPVLLSGLAAGAQATVEVGVEVAAPALPGSSRQVHAVASRPGWSTEQAATITVAEPGWVMWMVSHFHYDPVWWSTQGQFLQTRLLLPDDQGELPEVRTAFELVRLHLDAARRDPDYKFVLAEIDYLKPHFDAHPEDRGDLLDFIKAGRIELVGGSYNEPNTNLTCAESTIRNAVYGLAYQRDVLGGRPRTSWMLDAFGFDPGYPGLMAAAGLTESSWARGPFHQWGPSRSAGGNELMQFASEFEWLSPDGTGLLTAYMPNHYSAGWLAGHHAKTLQDALDAAYQQFRELKPVAATRNVLLPVGGDHVIPPRWATPIHREWNARYTWPRFVTAVPSEFFAAVRAEAADRDIWITPQTRDMNPVYTGKDVTYTDTKQGQRAAEVAVLDGERLATLAWLAGACYPAASLDKAWRQLVFGAHHDAITGTEGDQVYLDLLGGWREAWERGDQARRDAIAHLASLADTASLQAGAANTAGLQAGAAGELAVVVVNSLSFTRSAMATVRLDLPAGWPGWLELADDSGTAQPFLAEGENRTADGSLRSVTITFRAAEVPGVGYRGYLVRPASGTATAGWRVEAAAGQPRIENDALLVQADPARGGTLSRVLDKRSGTELLAPGGGGNELLLQPEHPAHPRWAEGPWLLCPAGPASGTAAQPAAVRAERCPVGSRLVTEIQLGGLRVTQETLLWDGADRVEFRTHVDGSIGQDHLLRVRFAANVPGGLPVYQTAVSVIGRPPGETDVDVAEHSYTLDSPAAEWLAVGSTARVSLPDAPGGPQLQAIGVAEVVCPPSLRSSARDLLAALASQGVTATCSLPSGTRYGYLELDSNLPDFRICLGGPQDNEFAAAVLAAAGPAAAAAISAQLAAGAGRIWIPAVRSRAGAFAPGADVRGPLDLPVLIVAARDTPAQIADLIADLADAEVAAGSGLTPDASDAGGAGGAATALAGHSVALLNRGTPSGLVTPDGALTMALMRSCSTWPCGVWIDGVRRTAPDGSSFAWQHWSHTFEYALAAGPGDWRTAGFAAAGQDYNHDLLATVTGIHAGPLPPRAELASVTPAAVALSTLKPFGNPLAPSGQPQPADGVTVRLRDLGGAGRQDARVRLLGGLAEARSAMLCEDAVGPALPLTDGAALVPVPAAGVTTAVLTPASATGAVAGERPAGAGPLEPAQPVYARYWLHGKGPAPAGNMPVAVHLSPAEITLDGGQPALVRLTVAGGPRAAAGVVELEAPPGFSLQPSGPLRYDLPPLGHLGWDLTVAAAAGGPPGRSFLVASTTGPDGQAVEDSVLLSIGQPARPAADLPLADFAVAQQLVDDATAAEIEVTVSPEQVSVPPGGTVPIEVTVASRCSSPIRGEAQLVSPYGSWHQAGPWTAGFSVEAGGRAAVRFDVTASPAGRPGEQWWAIVKVMYFGRLHYSEPVEVTIG